MKKILFGFLIFVILIFLGLVFIELIPKAPPIFWGVNFSQKQAENLGLDWQETFLAILDDLRVKNLKIATHWDLIEPGEGKFYFEDLDWQIREAEKRGAKILLVIGMKTPRWPECHLPLWAKNLSKAKQQEKILKLIEKIVLRYRKSKAIWAWQIENEPFLDFGECPWQDQVFLKKEINWVKSLDPERKILISASGEHSLWWKEAKLGDLVGITIYKKAWYPEFNTYFTYFFPPGFYWLKAKLIEKFFGKKVICVELQAEPWCPQLLYNCPLTEQEKTMDLDQFKKNINFAKRTGLDQFYLWGIEWMYWLKQKQNLPQIWLEVKKYFEND